MLLESIQVGSMPLKNRVVMLPMHFGMDLGSEQAREFYIERARGGVGAIVTAATHLDLFLSDDAKSTAEEHPFFKGLCSLAKAVHEAAPGSLGVKIGVQLLQLNHYRELAGNYEAINAKDEGEWVAPSARVEPNPNIHPVAPGTELREITLEEVEQVIANFAMAAVKVRDAGFDFVEIHACHGGLPCQFFSPIDNRRSDRYGGDLFRRMEFGIACVKSTRAAVGQDFPLFFRIGAEDDCAGGTTLFDSRKYAIELEKAGVDCFDVSMGVSSNRRYFINISPGPKEPMGTYVYLAEALKQAVKVPVIAAGRINTPEIAEAVISEGKADLVGLGRQLVADPMWPKKAIEGRTEDILVCDSCNQNCWSRSRYATTSSKPSLCHSNPRAGRELEMA
ncbi:NADH:flavin oxidoreductase [Chloroflexota bacterium]